MPAARELVLGLLLAGVPQAAAQPVPLRKQAAAENDRPALEAEAQAAYRQVKSLYGRGRLAEALAAAERTVALFRRLHPAGHPDLANSLNNLGFLRQEAGQLARAEPPLREALAMARKSYPPARFPAGHPHLVKNLLNLGRLLRARGELAQAEALAREALAMSRALYPPQRFAHGHPDLANSLNSLAVALQARGELAQAEPCFREALAVSRKLYPPERYPRGHRDLATSLDNLALALEARGDLAGAERLLREGLAMLRAVYPPERFPAGHPDLSTSFTNLGVLLKLRGDPARAEPFLRAALAMDRKLYPERRFPGGHPNLVMSLGNLGELLHGRGDLAGAEAFLREALAMARKLYPPERFPAGHSDVATSLTNLGMLLGTRGHPAGAEPHLREATAMEGNLVGAFLSGAAEAEALNRLAALPLTRDGYLSVTRELPGKEAATYAAVWQGKGLVARWLGRRRLAARAAGADARALAHELAAARRELAALLLTRQPGPAHAERLRDVTARKEGLEKALARRLPPFARDLELARRTPEDLVARLPKGTALVDLIRYARFDPEPAGPGEGERGRTACYAAFVVCRGLPVRRVELGPAERVEAARVAWLAALRDGRDDRPAAARFGRLVWEPLRRALPGGLRTLYLAPDGLLCQVPWAALPGGKEGGVLLEDLALAVVPHGQLLLEQLEAGAGRAGAGLLLAVGGVRYDDSPAPAKVVAPAARAPAAAAKGLRWPYLPGTERELERVLALAGERPQRRLGGPDATTSRLLAELPAARWAHLATHGFFADAKFRSALRLSEQDYAMSRRGERVGTGARSPLVLSGLVLAGANLEGQDAPPDLGILTAEAIAGLNLDGLELAALSACETGLGEVAGGEGVFGLQRAFHVAGCKNVVASLWQVDDEATAALMALFYDKLWREGLPPLEALRQAQLTLYRHPERIGALARARGPDFDRVARRPPEARPAAARAPARLWAGFVLSGAGR
jgi:CHAT domain-containing protein/tetratricopeptide (TPR) repeat protein